MLLKHYIINKKTNPMKKLKIVFLITLLFTQLSAHATHKVYLVHGYAGLGVELEKIHKAIKKDGYVSEIYRYPSLVENVDRVGKELLSKIQRENYDSVSFVTHSLGALVVRSMYLNLDTTVSFPFIHRFVMIAPPNNGSPIADFWAQFGFVKYIVGPNVYNLTTDPVIGAKKYPKPTCEVGIIAGNNGRKNGYSIFIVGEDDGIVPVKSAKLGTEQDFSEVKASHVALVINKSVIRKVLNFLNTGKF